MAAVVLVIGILLFFHEETGRSTGFLRSPYFFEVLKEAEKKEDDGIDGIVLEGDILEADDQKDRTVFLVDASDTEQYGKVRIYVKDRELSESLLIGQRVRFSGTMYLYKEAVNPGEFDTRAYYRHLGIYMFMTSEETSVLTFEYSRYREFFRRGRRKLLSVIERNAFSEDTAILKAVFLGDKSSVSDSDREMYKKMGVLHLLSVSGLHISVAAMGLSFILSKVSKRRRLNQLVTFTGVLSYTVLTGFSPSGQRALLSYSLQMVAPFFGRSVDLPIAMALSCFLLLLETPGYLFTSGFQYMAAAMTASAFGLPIVKRYLKSNKRQYLNYMYMLIIQMLILPISVVNGYEFSPYAIFSNALMVPMSGFLLSMTALGTGFGAWGGLITEILSKGCFLAAHLVLFVYRLIEKLFSVLPFHEIVTGRPSNAVIVFYLIMTGSVLFLLSYLVKKRKQIPEKEETTIGKGHYLVVSSLFLLVFLSGMILMKVSGTLRSDRVVHLYVGQGDCTMIFTEDRQTIVVDMGSTTEEKLYTNTLKPALFYYGRKNIDYLCLTHDDLDHTGAAADVLADPDVSVRFLVLPDVTNAGNVFSELIGLSGKRGTEVIYMNQGELIRLSDDHELQCLWPLGGSEYTGNDSSLVLLVKFNGFTELLTGDISSESERKLQISKVDVLKAAHHGSKYSSSEEFIKKTQPSCTIISAGKKNPYGHPHQECIERFLHAGTKILETKNNGAIIISIEENGYRTESFLKRSSGVLE